MWEANKRPYTDRCRLAWTFIE